MKIGFTSFVYCNYPLGDAIRHTARAGYDGIDTWGGRPHAYRRDFSQEQMRELSALLSALRLAVASFIPAQFRYPTCLCSGDEVVQRDSVAYIQEGVVMASALGAPTVSVCPGHSLYGQAPNEAWNRLGESLDAICSFATPYGIRVAIEPADRYQTDLITTTHDALAQSNLGIVLDTSHAQLVGESAEEAIGRLDDRLSHVHVDDNNGPRDEHLVPGEGTFPFEGFATALCGAGHDGFLSAELSWDHTVDPEPAVRTTAAQLDRLRGGA